MRTIEQNLADLEEWYRRRITPPNPIDTETMEWLRRPEVSQLVAESSQDPGAIASLRMQGADNVTLDRLICLGMRQLINEISEATAEDCIAVLRVELQRLTQAGPE